MRQTMGSLLALLALGLVASAAADDAAPRTAPLKAWAEINASGTVTAIDWHSDVDSALHAVGANALRKYPIAPARDALGHAAASRSWLTGQFVLREDGDEYVVSVRDLRAGPRVTRLKPPRFPLSALRTLKDGAVVARFTVGADGRASDIDTEVVAGPESFAGAVRDVLAQWRFEPERIDGQPTTQPMCIPFLFQYARRDPPEAPRAEHCRAERSGPVAQGQSPLWQRIEVTAQRR